MAAATARVMYGASESCADLLYTLGMFVPDPILWFEQGGTRFAVFSPLEIDRARKQARVDTVLARDECERAWQKQRRTKAKADDSTLAPFILKQHGVRKVLLPDWFPIGMAEAIRAAGISVRAHNGPFFPEREIKNAEEIRGILRGQRQAESGMRRAWEILRTAKVRKDGRLFWGGIVLTSETLRGEIDAAVVRAGGIPSGTIVACGRHACDPHERGHGPLFAGQLLILDIFPRDARTGYHGDLTRTVVKGRASDAQRKMYATVLKGQKHALRSLAAGVCGKTLHQQIVDMFRADGYPTELRDGRWVGFFHGTGHSLGLEIHEPPRFAAGTFKVGQIMTVEPGLYDPRVGGVRIEDLVLIGDSRARNLTRCPKFLEL